MTTREDFEVKHPVPKWLERDGEKYSLIIAGNRPPYQFEESARDVYNALWDGWQSHAAQSQQVIQDAARYRWLKQKDCLTEISNITPDAWDEAIDKFEERSAP